VQISNPLHASTSDLQALQRNPAWEERLGVIEVEVYIKNRDWKKIGKSEFHYSVLNGGLLCKRLELISHKIATWLSRPRNGSMENIEKKKLDSGKLGEQYRHGM
jgi:hypothetical protein